MMKLRCSDERGLDTAVRTRGPDELVLAALVARRYYVEDRSKVDIAEELDLSRFKVARLLETARSSGLVRIEIRSPDSVDLDLSGELRARFGLRHALVIRPPDDADDLALRRHVSRAAAELLAEIVRPDDVLGLGWARSLMVMSTELTRLAACPVVQLTGALTHPGVEESSIELVREVARVGGGPAFYFYAPLIVRDAATAASLRQQPEVERAFAQFDTVTKAMVGVGSWEPGQSTVFDALGPREAGELAGQGVRADLSGVLIDAAGQPVASALTDRMVGVTAEDLQRVPEVIGLAYGLGKVGAAAAGIAGGMLKGLVTHTGLARALLDRVGRSGASP